MSLQWSSDLEIGISVIDSQHQRIVDYINKVEEAHLNNSPAEVLDVLEELVDYTVSHFAFEETLLEEAGYPFIKAHKKVHELFTRRVVEYQNAAKAGGDVTVELLHTLKSWLVNHIKHDDKDYSKLVASNLAEATSRAKSRSGSWMSRLFG
jgi:hemerythrin